MNRIFRTPFIAASTLLLVAGCGSMEFTHVKPGQSARMELMARNAPTALPVAKNLPLPSNPGAISAANNAATSPLPNIAPNPALPDPGNTGEKVADLYTKGSFAMQAGQTGEAILALEEAVKMDPNFSDAWSKLVVLYQKAGQGDKAMEAYKRAKKLGQPNGPSSLTPTGSSALIP